jgi:hypothetical protein
VRVPVAQARAFYNPTCTLHCQEGVLVRAGVASICFCALKRCRDEVVRQRSVRATARPLPGVSTQVNPRELESVDKLSERAARLDAQIAEKDQAAAGEIAALIAQAESCDGAATLYTLEIRQAEEGLEVLAQRRRDREQELRDIEDAARDMTAALGASRVSEDEIVRKAVALRRQAAVLEGKRDQRTVGMRNLRDRLQRRINIKLARAPHLVASSAPASARIECSHGVLIGDCCAGCEAIEAARQVENGTTPPLPADPWPTQCAHGMAIRPGVPSACAGCAAADMCQPAVVESSSVLAGPPEEKTPVVEVLDNGTLPARELPAIGEPVEVRSLDSRGKPDSDWCRGTVHAHVPPDGVDVLMPGDSSEPPYVYEWRNGHGPSEWRRPVATATEEPAA